MFPVWLRMALLHVSEAFSSQAEKLHARNSERARQIPHARLCDSPHTHSVVLPRDLQDEMQQLQIKGRGAEAARLHPCAARKGSLSLPVKIRTHQQFTSIPKYRGLR